MKYRIASLSLKCDRAVEDFKEFKTLSVFPSDVSVTTKEMKLDTLQEIMFTDHGELAVGSARDGRWFFSASQDKKLNNMLIASRDYAQLQIMVKVDGLFNKQAIQLLRFALCCRLLSHQTLTLHAACVEKDGQAVAFTGESGLGKSTRARAWVENLSAEWISGDRPAVRLEKEWSTACGVPWDGKEQIFRNVERPLKAILEVRRSESNYIRRLTKDQARQLLMQQTFVPMWDTESAILAMANVRKLIDKTPVYRVFCGPDGDSAREIYDILFHHPEKIREEKEQMKVKDGFVLRNVVDEYIVMPTGDNIAKFEGAVVLNEVSAFVFEKLQHPMSKEDLLQAILDEFDVDEETAKNDLDALVEKLSDMGLIDA